MTDNVFTFISAMFAMWHRGADPRRLPRALNKLRRADMTEGYVRRYPPRYENVSSDGVGLYPLETDAEAYDVAVRRHGIDDLLSSILYLKANFTAKNYNELREIGQYNRLAPWVDEKHDPDSCKSMSELERRGMSAFAEGADFMPDVPIYGRADDTAGYGFYHQ